MNIVDQWGRPLNRDKLKRSARPHIERQQNFSTKIDPKKLGQILRAAKTEGDLQGYIDLAEIMEEEYLHYASVLGTRKLAVLGLDIEIEAAGDSAIDQRATAACRDLVKSPRFFEALAGLLDAMGKGFAVVRMEWETGQLWRPGRYVWERQSQFMWVKGTLHWRTQSGPVPIEPFTAIIHSPSIRCGNENTRGLAYLCALAYVATAYNLRDWISFLEVYGQPIKIGRYDATHNDEDRRVLKGALVNLASDFAGMLPKGMDIELHQPKQGPADGFEQLASHLEGLVSKAVLGQTMTADDGASLSQAQVHDEVRQDILEADSKFLAATVQEMLINPFCYLNFGEIVPPAISFPIPEPDNQQLLLDVVDKIGERLGIERKWIRDKFGIPEPTENDLFGSKPSTAETTRNHQGKNILDRVALNTRKPSNDLDWQPSIDEIIGPVRELLDSSSSLEQFGNDLASLADQINPIILTQTLGRAMFESRTKEI